MARRACGSRPNGCRCSRPCSRRARTPPKWWPRPTSRPWSRGGAGGDRARPARGLGSAHRGLARRLGGDPGRTHRCGARGAAGRGRGHARRLHRRRRAGERVVRATAAGAHPSLHRQAPARGDRAHRGTRLPALPVRLAARGAGAAHGGAGCGRRDPRAARGLRGPRQCLGDRDPAPPHQRVRTGVAGRAVPRGPLRLDAAGTAARGSGTRRRTGARHADRAAWHGATCGCGRASPARWTR